MNFKYWYGFIMFDYWQKCHALRILSYIIISPCSNKVEITLHRVRVLTIEIGIVRIILIFECLRWRIKALISKPERERERERERGGERRREGGRGREREREGERDGEGGREGEREGERERGGERRREGGREGGRERGRERERGGERRREGGRGRERGGERRGREGGRERERERVCVCVCVCVSLTLYWLPYLLNRTHLKPMWTRWSKMDRACKPTCLNERDGGRTKTWGSCISR